jgi:hypothetical protein
MRWRRFPENSSVACAAVPWAWAGQWRSSTMWDGQLALLAGAAEQAGVLDAFVRLVRWQFGERPASAMVPWRST